MFTGDATDGLILGFVFVIIYALFTYFVGDKLVLKMSGAKEADKNQYRDLYDAVEGITGGDADTHAKGLHNYRP